MDSPGGKGSRWLYLAAIAVLSVAVIFLLFSNMQGLSISGSQSQAEGSVKELFGILAGGDVEIASIMEESGIYKMLVKIPTSSGTPAYQEVYVTKDGKLVTDKLLAIEDYRKSLLTSRNFSQCLSDSGVIIVGLSTNNYTVMQVQLLGDFGSRLYYDCGGDNMATCQQLNITMVPSVVVNNTIYEGLKPVEWFEQMTGCRWGA